MGRMNPSLLRIFYQIWNNREDLEIYHYSEFTVNLQKVWNRDGCLRKKGTLPEETHRP